MNQAQLPILPHLTEPCPLCEAKGWRHVCSFSDPRLQRVKCCDCLGTGRRPVRGRPTNIQKQTMIEGLKVTIVGTELRELCLKRAEHHRQRARVYAGQKASMEENEIGEMAYSNGDPKLVLKDKQEMHEAEAGELDFIAAHLISDEQYSLDASALVKLGISKRGY